MIQNRKYLPFKNNAMSFSKYRPSFYKLTNKQIKQLIKYLMNPSIQEELNFALKHMSICPYCASEDFYKTKNKSSIYQWKCESCHKSFNILHKSPLSCILPNYSTKYYQRDIKKTLRNTEVWLHFKIKHDSQYKIIPRKDIISTSFRWKHHIIQIPKDLKKDHLNNIRKYNKEAFNNLINLGTNNQYKDKSNKKYIVLTFEEGKFIPKKYFVGIPDQPSHSSSHILENYILANTKKKCQQEYERLKNILINSYNDKCETINMPQKNDPIYTNIKIPYKHTYTLAYAMAIRNKEVKKILFILKYLKNVSRDILAHKTSMITNYSNFLSHELHKQYLSLGVPNINNMINEFEEQLRKEYLIIPRENKVVTPETHKILVRRAIYNSLDPNKYKWHPRYQQELKYKFEEMEHDDYINSIGIFEGDDVFDINVIRPTFTSHIIDKNTTLVPINFTLSTDEIIALIKKIKQDFQKDQNIIKTPMELLGGELETIVEAKEAQYLPNSFEKKLETMSKALFAYDKYQYLTQQQKQKEDEKKRLETLKENELKPYKKVGNSTRIEKKNMMKIEKKYQPKLQKLEEEIMHIGKSSKNKYKLISNDINMSESNTERYIKFMKEYIEGKKYKKLFIKMS